MTKYKKRIVLQKIAAGLFLLLLAYILLYFTLSHPPHLGIFQKLRELGEKAELQPNFANITIGIGWSLLLGIGMCLISICGAVALWILIIGLSVSDEN